MEDKPWETYKSDDPKVKAEQLRTRRIKAAPKEVFKPAQPKPPAPPTATDAWTKAYELKARKDKVEKLTKPWRKALPGQEE